MRRVLFALPSVFLALIILMLSIFKTVQPRFNLGTTPPPVSNQIIIQTTANYQLPMGEWIGPDSILWPIIAFVDRVNVISSFNPKDRALVLLSLADRRLVASQVLFRQGKPQLALGVLTKAEKYLESASLAERSARLNGENTDTILYKLSMASMAHIKTIESLLLDCPEQARPMVVAISDYPKRLYNETYSRPISLFHQ